MDGVKLSTEVVYKRGQDYKFACYDRGRACQSYRVRFLCGKPGERLLSCGVGVVGEDTVTVFLLCPWWLVHLCDTGQWEGIRS